MNKKEKQIITETEKEIKEINQYQNKFNEIIISTDLITHEYIIIAVLKEKNKYTQQNIQEIKYTHPNIKKSNINTILNRLQNIKSDLLITLKIYVN